MGLVTRQNGHGPQISLPIHCSAQAPQIARRAVLSRLEGRVTDETTHDIALLVTELVTNSVLHAGLGADDTVLVEVTFGDDSLAIAVTDAGSDLVPQLRPWDLARPNGLGLRLVDSISTSWGVRRSPDATQVWCELPLGEMGTSAA